MARVEKVKAIAALFTELKRIRKDASDPQDRDILRLTRHILNEEKVGAIKEIRAMAGCSLREAVDLHTKYVGW